MPAFSILAAVSAATQVVSTLGAIQAKGKQAEAERKLATVRTLRERRRAIAQSQIARAQAVARTEAAGAKGSVQEGLEAAATGAGAAQIGFLAKSGALTEEASRAAQEASIFGVVGGLAGTIFSGTGGFENLFKPKADTDFSGFTPGSTVAPGTGPLKRGLF